MASQGVIPWALPYFFARPKKVAKKGVTYTVIVFDHEMELRDEEEYRILFFEKYKQYFAETV